MSVAVHLPGFRLQPPHPLAGSEAYQCRTCQGIFYVPPADPERCPYCHPDEDDGA